MWFEGIYMLVAFSLKSLPEIQGASSISYSTTRVCGVKGASVVLPCRYEYSGIGSYTMGEWIKDKGTVRKHSDSKYPDCSLKIDNLSNDHVGVYNFRFSTTLRLYWLTGQSGIVVSITDLQVKEGAVGKYNLIKVTCSASCSLGSHFQYIWHKNGQPLQGETTASLLLDSTRPSEKGSYSCAVSGHEDQRSSAVCVPAEQCWGVIYSSNSICVLKGSTVDMSCTYNYPRNQNISTTFWVKPRSHTEDLSLDNGYQHHIEYLGNKSNSCTLRLKELSQSHSGEYAFRFITGRGQGFSGLPGVTISVTALQVFLSPEAVKEGESLTLTCNTTCILTNPTFIWYTNGQPVTYKHTTRDNKLHLNPVSSEDAGSYSCAVKGHESLSSTAVFLHVRYKPKNVLVSVSPGERGLMEGSSVTLTCSSDANPPVHNYTWYMKNGAESLVRGTGESISFNVTSDTSGLYHCEAQNEEGSQNSAGVVILTEEEHAAAMAMKSGIIIAVIVASILVFAAVFIGMYKKRNFRGKRQNVKNDTYVALQRTGQASAYGILQRGEMPQMELQDLPMRGQDQPGHLDSPSQSALC
ncbi:B-cell receptor CD22-like [Alosa sapidissima]|uniref:B-cell receptor CD22-like n=1 Tax=Alosa sapidissima TaxID=34773 RepID=UPI001C08A6A9|nr:B-cell receptor CD22-like [Alosa sapidissima]